MNRKITIRIVLIITVFLILSSSLFAPIYPDAFKLSSREEFLLRVIMLIVTIVVTAPIWIPMVIIAVVVDKKEKKEEKEEKDYSTQSSQVVSNPSTNRARRGLTSLIGREVVLSSWYGRNHYSFLLFSSFSLYPSFPFLLFSSHHTLILLFL